MKTVTLHFNDIAAAAGFTPGADGKLVLPNTQHVADQLARAAVECLGGPWQPGMDRFDVTVTGAGPIWAWLKIGHALHAQAVRLTYAAPNGTFVVFDHGA